MNQLAAGGAGGAGRGSQRPLKVFISYRRKDVPDATYRLAEGLEKRFGAGSVFIDVDHIGPGEEYTEVIPASVAKSDVFLLIIGDRWLSDGCEDGVPRIKTTGDLVRLEVEAALESGVPVVPVLVENATVPEREDLPDSIARLPRLQAFKIARSHWRYDVERLEDAIEQLANTPSIDVPGSMHPEQGGPKPSREVGQPGSHKLVPAVAVAVALAVVGAAVVVFAPKGPNRAQVSIVSHSTSAPTGTGTATTSARAGSTAVATTARSATTAVGSARTSPARPITRPTTQALGPEQAVNGYWQGIDAHRFGSAYAYLDSEYKHGESKSTFVRKHEAEGIKEARFRGQSTSDNGSLARVNVLSLRTDDHAKGCREWGGYYKLRSVDGRWLIHEAHIEVHNRCHG